jgi:hypothetical protein
MRRRQKERRPGERPQGWLCFGPTARTLITRWTPNPMIHAGTVADIVWRSGTWVFLDIGFAKKKKSCGLLVHDAEPNQFQFNKARDLIVDITAKATGPVNLTIEAPLSVAFDKSGNPNGRRIEKQGAKTRYWYNGLGCAVMVAAMYLVRAIHDACPKQHVRLFEGFVSFKNPEIESDHRRDVLLMRQVVMEPVANAGSIIGPDALKMANDDRIVSAFCVGGLDYGVPPVIKCDG